MTAGSQDLILQRIFSPWRGVAAAGAFPAVSALTDELERRLPPGRVTQRIDVPLQAATSRLFASAAIEIWQRAVHSLLISIALTRQSVLWSTICGYYATHYTFRGLAHLLGHYQMFRRHLIAQLSLDNGVLICSFSRGREREHDWYRRIVGVNPLLNTDPFFALPTPPSEYDVVHRDRANYADHLNLLPTLQNQDREFVRQRLAQMARIESLVPSEILVGDFPNLDAVQINAYQRIARFRRFLDESIEDNRLWSYHRNPGWAMPFTNFEIVEPRGAAQR